MLIATAITLKAFLLHLHVIVNRYRILEALNSRDSNPLSLGEI